MDPHNETNIGMSPQSEWSTQNER
jgi:hypothetical protein